MLISERVEDQINKIVSEKEGKPLSVIEALNNFQWKIVLEATKNCRSIEITGLARLKVKKYGAIESNIDKLNNIVNVLEKKKEATDNEKAINRINLKIKGTKETIEYLKSKL